MTHSQHSHDLLYGQVISSPARIYRELRGLAHSQFLKTRGLLFLLCTPQQSQPLEKFFWLTHPLHPHTLPPSTHPSTTPQPTQPIHVYFQLTELLKALLSTAHQRQSTLPALPLYYEDQITLKMLHTLEHTAKAINTPAAPPLTCARAESSQPFAQSVTAEACEQAQEVYRQAEMGAIYAYRFLKPHTPTHYVENECQHYLSLKTRGTALSQIWLQTSPFADESLTKKISNPEPFSHIADPSIHVLNISLTWKGVTVQFTKTLTTTTTATLPPAFIERYESFQKAVETFLSSPSAAKEMLTAESSLECWAIILSQDHETFMPLTEEMLTHFYTTPCHDVMNLLLCEKTQQPLPAKTSGFPSITESLIIRKKLKRPRTAAKSAAETTPKIYFEQDPPHHPELLRFF